MEGDSPGMPTQASHDTFRFCMSFSSGGVENDIQDEKFCNGQIDAALIQPAVAGAVE